MDRAGSFMTMAERIDYLDDPAAPKANSILPSANVIVVNSQGQILLIRRTDNGNWAVPGGGMDPGESITDTAVRETLEETGITCEITGLVGIYTSPRHVIRYTSNDEVRQEFSIVFTARPVGGELRPSNESAEPQWVYPASLTGLQMHASMRLRIQHYLDKRTEPYLG
jgi:8-oxo-dGTP pyrophosphatase MutT (NUDIX family)